MKECAGFLMTRGDMERGGVLQRKARPSLRFVMAIQAISPIMGIEAVVWKRNHGHSLPMGLFVAPSVSTRTDALTGLLSADAARERIAYWTEQNPARQVLAMQLGFRRFQSVNLGYGLETGNDALVEIARRVAQFSASELGADALVARIGGSEFLIATTDDIDRDHWQWLAEALCATLSKVLLLKEDRVRLIPRVALLEAPAADGAAVLFDRLDQTMLHLHGCASHRILWGDRSHPMQRLSSAQLEADLLGAISRDEIAIRFQPQFETQTGRLVGAEALARWNHPELGMVDAAQLFASAARADHISQLSRHILTRSLQEAGQWGHRLRLSVNVTAEDLAEPDFADFMQALIADTRFEPRRLTLEVTEQALLHDLADSGLKLCTLVQEGITIALDDFGTGFSNFGYLKSLPVHCLKLDRLLVRDLGADDRDRAILLAILGMAEALGLSVVAEGVEREEQLAVLKADGCPFYQGFLGSPPLTATELMRVAADVAVAD